MDNDVDATLPGYALVAILAGALSAASLWPASSGWWWVVAHGVSLPPYAWGEATPFRWKVAWPSLAAMALIRPPAVPWTPLSAAVWTTRLVFWDRPHQQNAVVFALFAYVLPSVYAGWLVPTLVTWSPLGGLLVAMVLRSALRTATQRLWDEDRALWHDAWWSIPPAVAVLRAGTLPQTIAGCGLWALCDAVLPPHRRVYRIQQLPLHLVALWLAYRTREQAVWTTDDLCFRLLVFHVLDILGASVTELYLWVRRLREPPRFAYEQLITDLLPHRAFRRDNSWDEDRRYRLLCWLAPAAWTRFAYAP